MFALVLSAILAFTPSHHRTLEGRWHLGHGYTALAYRLPDRLSTRTFEIVRGGRVVRRWHPPTQSGFALQVLTEDLTGDGIKDVLVYSDTGGSGGWGNYRLYGGPRLRELWADGESVDTAGLALGRHRLDVWHAILSSKTKKSGTYIHCCWSRWRHTEWRWRSGRFLAVKRTVSHHRGPWHEGPTRE